MTCPNDTDADGDCAACVRSPGGCWHRRRNPYVPTYHDLHITTDDLPRTSIFDLPYGMEVTCTRVGGWQLWRKLGDHAPLLLAGEFDDHGLRLDVGGDVVIVDSIARAIAWRASADHEA